MTTSTTELRTPPTLSADTDRELFTALLEAGSATDPYPTYRRLRARYPVVGVLGTVGLFRYHDVVAVLRHPRVSTDDRRSALHQELLAGDRLAPGYLSQVDDQSFLHRDPPEHTRLRRLVTSAFTPRRIEALRPFVHRTVDRIVTAAAATGRLELVHDLAYPMPIEVICELLGIPAEDRPFVASWPRTQLCCSFEAGSVSAIGASETDNRRRLEVDRIQQQLTDYFALLIDRRRARPGDDLISALIAAQEHGEQLTDAEINATVRLMFVAGYENAVNLIGNGVLALLRHPDHWAALSAHPDLAGGAVEEVLRYDPPLQLTRRVALTDLDVGGCRIAQGQHLILWLAAANHDPAQFHDPDRFDIHRVNNHHVAFGSGIHACLGGPLARLEAEIVFTTLTRCLIEPRMEIDPPRYRTNAFRSLAELQLTITDADTR